MEKLLIWLNNNNVNTNNLKIINQKNNERGVVSSQNIKQGEYVFLIPKHLIITNKTADMIPEIKEVNRYFRKTPTEINIIKITVFMLYAEAYEDVMSDVDWTPYFDTIPETLDHIPTFWEDDLKYLKGSYLFKRVMERNKLMKEEFKILRKNLEDFREFSFYEYQRMRSLVSSRNFKLTINNDIVSAMVPLADMLNHSNTCQTTWSFNDRLQSYQMLAKASIKVGDEITDSYGVKPMDNYFMYYGFVLPDSEVRLFVEFENFNGYINSNINQSGFNSLLTYVRSKVTNNPYSNYYKDRHSELKVMQIIYKLLDQMKKKYPHTKNYYLKHKQKGSQNKKNAYTIIAGELNIIEELLNKVSLIIKYLSGKKVKIEYDDVNKYILNNIIRQ